MTVTLRVVLDQLVSANDPDLAMASRELARALVQSAPAGCDVGAIVPSGPGGIDVPGISDVHRMGMARRELAAAWQLGVAPGVGGGLIHAPTLLAPLVRHDRVNDHDQTVVTLWDLRPWEHPDELPRTAVTWHRAMLKRAEKHADAVVVPTHAMAERLAELSRLGTRIRVIAGAAPSGFGVPQDAVGRRRTLGLPEAVVVMAGDAAPSAALATGFAALAAARVDLPVVVLDAGEGQEPAIVDLAAAAGVPERQVHVRGGMDAADRAAVLDAAVVHVAPSRRAAFPWRVVESLVLGVPVVAAASDAHREVIVDGGLVTGGRDDAEGDAEALGAAVSEALASATALDRLAVLAADRGRAFSWHEAAERVWQLHADL
jgi:glycosyltransferase involved in cell wall biosynthesis